MGKKEKKETKVAFNETTVILLQRLPAHRIAEDVLGWLCVCAQNKVTFASWQVWLRGRLLEDCGLEGRELT